MESRCSKETREVVGGEVGSGVVAVLHLSRQGGLGFRPGVSGATCGGIEEVERGVGVHVFGYVSREPGAGVVVGGGGGSPAIGEQGGCLLSHYFPHVLRGVESFEGVCRFPVQEHAFLVAVIIPHAGVGGWTVGIGGGVRIAGVRVGGIVAGGCRSADALCA